jgi:GxxExxY protein
MHINELSHQIIGAAIEVHKTLGPGLLESVYEECLCRELELQNIPFVRQLELPVVYKELELGCGYRLDLVVDSRIVVELKSVESIKNIHKAQIMTYLKMTGNELGLLINFNVEKLIDGVTRVAIGAPNLK